MGKIITKKVENPYTTTNQSFHWDINWAKGTEKIFGDCVINAMQFMMPMPIKKLTKF